MLELHKPGAAKFPRYAVEYHSRCCPIGYKEYKFRYDLLITEFKVELLKDAEMGRDTYFHAIILPVSCYAAELEKSTSTTRQWKRENRIEALYNSDDLARHMANHVMNQNPALSVTYISTPDLMPRGLWRDPYRIYATIFSQASRVLFLVTESDQDEFEDFFENHLLHFFKQLQSHRSFSEWNTRFIVVVMGDFELPAVLCGENPPCEVVRFREIGWFRDSIALMMLYQKIKGNFGLH
ncbi:unnamed protein product [Dibothriocephalus latus]|uniref:Uncharacterized protein n=1 Tax=Dibothriocephalus latus TaxID=60516 RepID=A0A3P6V1J5_DIBLA|nr:unnamed protein product [Dibothriocephalus latus]